MSVLSDDEFLDTEPYVENEDYWIQAAEPGSRAYVAAHGSSEKSPERPAAKEPSEEHRQVVTASGNGYRRDHKEKGGSKKAGSSREGRGRKRGIKGDPADGRKTKETLYDPTA